MFKANGKVNMKNINLLNNMFIECFDKSVHDMHEDLKKSQTMPYKTGATQETQEILIENKKGIRKLKLATKTPYSRRLYFHPEFNFSRAHNVNAQGMWLETYLNGQKKDYVIDAFANRVRGKMK